MRVRQRTRSVRAIWAPSLLRRLIRHRYFQAAAVLGLGLLAATSLAAKSAELDTARSEWGETRQVAVLVEAVAVGDGVAPAVELRELPVGMVPAGAVGEVPSDALAKVRLYPGETVLAERLTSSAGDLAPTDTSALTVPVVTQLPLVEEGDLVDLWMVDSANFSSHRVARAVVVLAFSEKFITVAVPNDDVAEATVASLRPVTVTLVG